MDLFSPLKKWFAPTPTTTRPNLQQFASSKQGKRIIAELVQQNESLTKKDVATWRAAWQAALNLETPNRLRLYDVYTDCLVDLHLSGCIGQRKGKTLQKQFRLVGRDGKENIEATKLLQREWFSDFIDLALDSRFWGHSLIQLGDVINDENGIRFDGVELVPRKHVCPEYGVVTREPAGEPKKGMSYREGDFALWCVEVGKPKDLGLLLKCAPSCLSKKNMLAFWDMFGEIFGAPMRIAKTTTNDEAERRRIEGALEEMGAAFWGLFPDGTDIEIKESSRGDAYNVYDKRVDRCNSELSKGILMQTMTIDNGSSHSQSETHLEIFENVVTADATMVANVVNDRLLPLMVRHGFPVKGLRFEWDNTASLSAEDRLRMEQVLLEHYDIDPQYFIDAYNVPITGARSKSESEAFFA